MYKIFLTVRNRLAITQKCIESLQKHSAVPHQIYVYDNLTNYQLKEHFDYFNQLIKDKIICQVTFNTNVSTFNAFSKAVACNQFGRLHEDDPNKNDCDFLLFLDNDIIVTPKFDEILSNAWRDIRKINNPNLKIITQCTQGGVMYQKNYNKKIAGFDTTTGTHGGSGFWSIKSNFFSDIGYLDLNKLVNLNKKHDQHYWSMIQNKVNGNHYILCLNHRLFYHMGITIGSVCNVLTKKRSNSLEEIKFINKDNEIKGQDFNTFYNNILK